MEKFEEGDCVRRKGTKEEMWVGQKDTCTHIDTCEVSPNSKDKEWCWRYEEPDCNRRCKQAWEKIPNDDLELVSRFPTKPNV
jgi:hypothetical protein